MQRIIIFTTGGTIDAQPYENTPEYITPGERSRVFDVIDELGATHCDIIEFDSKDSKDYSEEEIIELAELIKSFKAFRFIITHGTDAMIKNAKLFQEIFSEDTLKTIIFTGAMIPLSHGAASDGKANLQFAINLLEEFDEGGVYIVGREEISPGKYQPGLFKPDHVRKDYGRKVFVRQDSEIPR